MNAKVTLSLDELLDLSVLLGYEINRMTRLMEECGGQSDRLSRELSGYRELYEKFARAHRRALALKMPGK